MNSKNSLISYIFCCFFIFSTILFFPNWKHTGGSATISWDVTGYYAYLPAGLIYRDFSQLKFREDIQNKYRLTGLDHAAFPHESGTQVMKYPAGMAVAYLPWFLVAHAYASLSSYPADGFSIPYQFFLTFGCLIYAFIGLWFLRKILLRYFSDTAYAIVLLLIALGTNYFNYTAFDMLMPHQFIFTLYAILVWQTIRWYDQPTKMSSLLIGGCIGLATLARPTEAVSVLIPLLWGLNSWSAIVERFFLWKKHFVKLLLTGGVIFVIGMLQIIYWKMVSGEFIVYSYQDQGFSWNGVHLKDCFFSFRKGWLVYTPLMTFALLGFIFLFKKHPKIFPAAFAFFLINTYIIFSWDIWWYGGGFGQRAMIPSYVLLSLPLAALIDFILHKKIRTIALGIPVGIAMLFCIWLNLFQTWQAHGGGGFETEAMTEAYYWKIFGQTNPDPEWRILLDTDEEFLGEPKNLKQLYFNDFESETDSINFNNKNSKSGEQALFLSHEVQFSPKFSAPLPSSTDATWVRAWADFYCENKEWNFWMMGQFVITLEQDDTIVKEKMIRVHRVLGEKTWRRIPIVIKIPEGLIFNNVKVKFWNAGGNKSLWIDDLEIEIFND